MSRKLLLVLLTAFSSMAAIASPAAAQEQELPKCYIIEPDGELRDLTDLCNTSQQQSPEETTANIDGVNVVNNNNNTIDFVPLQNRDRYIFGDDGFTESGDIDSSYYIDNEIGSDYTAYTRRYRISNEDSLRAQIREQVFRFDDSRDSLTSIIRRGRDNTPFLIYRYQI